MGNGSGSDLAIQKKAAFTLAEVLIVIGVIGVVAAITIPTLINIISSKAKQAQTDVIETRLLDGINRFSATDDGLSQKYETTYDFLQGLSKHYKMSEICKADEITKCFPYSKIYSQDGSKSAYVKSLKTIHQFIFGDGAKDYLAPASFINAQGTPFVMALKKNCVWDMGQAMQSIEDSECIAYLYDKNGAALPNKVGEDLVGHGLTINGFPLAILGGVKIMTNAKVSTPMTKAECEANKSKYGIKACESNNDYWAGAMKECNDKNLRLPTDVELIKIAQELYNDTTLTSEKYGLTMDASKIPIALFGIGTSWNYLWSSSEHSSGFAWHRYFDATHSYRLYRSRYDNFLRGVCVSD